MNIYEIPENQTMEPASEITSWSVPISIPKTFDPIIKGLLDHLPDAGEVWPEAEREQWLSVLSDSFKLVYKDKESLKP